MTRLKPFEISIDRFFPNEVITDTGTNRFRIVWIDKHIRCIRPGESHEQAIRGEEGLIIQFTESFLIAGESEFDLVCHISLRQLFSSSRSIVIDDDFQPDMKVIVTRMLNEYDNVYSYKAVMLKRYLKIFLLYLTRQLEESPEAFFQTRNMRLVQKFMEDLDVNFRQKKQVSDYARNLYVTPGHLNCVLKKTTGYPASRHIRQRIIQEAKRIIITSNATMKEVAYELGFLDISHFSKFFKSNTGNSFTEFIRILPVP